MSKEIFELIFEEFKKNGVKLIDYDFKVDTFVADPSEIATSPLFRGDEFPPLLDFTEHDKVFEDKIAKLEENIGYYKDSFYRAEKNCDKLYHENKELKQKISDLESLMQKRDEFLEMKNIQIDELKQRIAELESKENIELPFDPLECANYLINATWERETSSLERGILKCPEYVSNNKYGIDELEQIAEHLLVYCKHNKESE